MILVNINIGLLLYYKIYTTFYLVKFYSILEALNNRGL